VIVFIVAQPSNLPGVRKQRKRDEIQTTKNYWRSRQARSGGMDRTPWRSACSGRFSHFAVGLRRGPHTNPRQGVPAGLGDTSGSGITSRAPINLCVQADARSHAVAGRWA
jgi:hypothetical protein